MRLSSYAAHEPLASKAGAPVVVGQLMTDLPGSCGQIGGQETINAPVGPTDTYATVACMTGPRLVDLDASIRAMLQSLLYLPSTR